MKLDFHLIANRRFHHQSNDWTHKHLCMKDKATEHLPLYLYRRRLGTDADIRRTRGEYTEE